MTGLHPGVVIVKAGGRPCAAQAARSASGQGSVIILSNLTMAAC